MKIRFSSYQNTHYGTVVSREIHRNVLITKAVDINNFLMLIANSWGKENIKTEET